MNKYEIETTVQESKGKFTTPIPMALIKILKIEKSDKLSWSIENDKIIIKVNKIRR